MDGVVRREEVEMMALEDLQTLYLHVVSVWPAGLRPYRWNSKALRQWNILSSAFGML